MRRIVPASIALLLVVVVAGAVVALTRRDSAKPKPAAGSAVKPGDAAHGKVVFRRVCAPCHGRNAEGRVGPRLAGTVLTRAAAKGQIDGGGGIMPARLVRGRTEEDVLAYLDSIAAPG